MKTLLLLLFLFTTNISSSKVISANYVLTGKIDVSTEAAFKALGMILAGKTITIIINSPGGYLESFMGIKNTIEQLQSYGTFFECHLYAGSSAAASIFTLCDKRVAYTNSVFGQHRAGNLSGICGILCVAGDLQRLEKEAALQNIPLLKYRESLPDVLKMQYTYGAAVYRKNIANFYVFKQIDLIGGMYYAR